MAGASQPARFYALLGGDYGIIQTLSRIKSNIQNALYDPAAQIRFRAESLLSTTPERDDLAEMQSIFNWVQARFHYVHDPVMLEMVKTPQWVDSEIESQGNFMGDCDDATAYLGALLLSVGYPVGLVVISPQGSPDDTFRHIYLRAWSEQQKAWIGLDPTAKNKPFGWEAPNQRERMEVIS